MIVLPEPIPIAPEDPNASFLYDNQLRTLLLAAQNLSLTQRAGAVQNNDKAGNLSAVYVVFTSNGTANTEDTITHTLGRIPIGYIPVKQDKSAVLYSSGTTDTSTIIYLKTSVATVTWTVLLF